MTDILLYYLGFSVGWCLFVGIFTFITSKDLWYATKSLVVNLLLCLPAIIYIIVYIIRYDEAPPVKTNMPR